MTIYAKTLSLEWREAFEAYEHISGYEPMYQDDIDEGVISVEDAWKKNVAWLEIAIRDIFSEVTRIETPD